jgi:RNA polymerase sigma-70 factor, ECF subfamily
VSIEHWSEGQKGTHSLEIPDPAPDPEANYLRQEKSEALAAAINNLKAGVRTAIELRELAEFSTQEAARCMGLSVAAAKGRVLRGRRELRTALRGLGFAPFQRVFRH